MGVSDEHSSIEGVLLEATQAVLRQKDAERLRELRLSALLTLQEQLMSHRRNGILEDILCRLAGKKADRILTIRTKEEAERLAHLPEPHFDGNRYVAAADSIPEEELLFWCELSKKVPVNASGAKRYSELFRALLPDEYDRMFPEPGAGNEKQTLERGWVYEAFQKASEARTLL